jgi:hypothetical protein
MAAAKAARAMTAAAEVTVTVSRPGGEVAMAKMRVEVDLGCSRKSRPSGSSGRIWARTTLLGQAWAGSDYRLLGQTWAGFGHLLLGRDQLLG